MALALLIMFFVAWGVLTLHIVLKIKNKDVVKFIDDNINTAKLWLVFLAATPFVIFAYIVHLTLF